MGVDRIAGILSAVTDGPLVSVVRGSVGRLRGGSERGHYGALRILTEKVNSSHELGTVLSHVLEGVAEMLHCTAVWICLPDEDDHASFSVVATRGEGAPLIGTSVAWSSSGAAVGGGETDSSRGNRGGSGRPGPDGGGVPLDCLTLPMEDRGNVAGLLCIGRRGWKGLRSREDSDLLRVVCNHAALALANVELLDRLHRVGEQLTAQIRDKVDDQMRSLLDANERLRKMHEQAERLATVDGLTGLHNHRHFWERLSEEMSRAKRFKHRFSVLFMDVDGLKKVNDIHGHMVGDRLLRRLGEMIVGETRSCDVAARYGGDEFAVLLTETDSSAASTVAHRLRALAASLTVPDEEGRPVSASFSIGTATYPQDGDTEWELLHLADQAAYREKRRGTGGQGGAG